MEFLKRTGNGTGRHIKKYYVKKENMVKHQ